LEAKSIFDVNKLKMTRDKCADKNAPKDTGAVQKEGEEVQVAKKASEDRKEAEMAKIKWSLKFCKRTPNSTSCNPIFVKKGRARLELRIVDSFNSLHCHPSKLFR
jgi:hypothetical protein